jgi:hypothetical protein
MKNFFRKFGTKLQQSTARATPIAKTSVAKPAFRWIIDRQMAVGPIPDATLYDQLIAAGFKSVLTLCGEDEGILHSEIPTNFHWQRLVLPDSHYTESLTASQLAQAVTIARQAIVQKPPIYIHCLAGMERSPSVCIAYLCLHEGMEVWEALNWVKQRNARTRLSTEQVQVIQALTQQVDKSSY